MTWEKWKALLACSSMLLLAAELPISPRTYLIKANFQGHKLFSTLEAMAQSLNFAYNHWVPDACGVLGA